MCTAVITFFKGFDAFIGPFQAANFITYAFRPAPAPLKPNSPRFLPSPSAYIGLPVFGVLFVFWKWRYGDRTVPYRKMDLISGKEEIDLEEEQYLAAQLLKGPAPRWRKIWDAL